MNKQNQSTLIKKGISSFSLVGKAKINDYSFTIDKPSKSSDWVYNSLNLGIDCGNGNIVYSSLMGGYGENRNNICYVHGKDANGKPDYSNTFQIDWEDRFNQSILDNIASDCFIKVGLEKDNKGQNFIKHFLSPYDAIVYIKEHLSSDTVVRVNGSLQYQCYRSTNEIKVNKNITSIYLSKSEPKDFKATFVQTILLDSDSIGKLENDSNTIPIYAYVVDYISKFNDQQIKQNVVIPKTFELEINEDKPEQFAKFINKFFKVKKKNSVDLIVVEGEFNEGLSINTATLDDLPEDIISLIDCGCLTEEEALAKYTTGQKDKRMIIKRPYIKKSTDPDNDSSPTLSLIKETDKYSLDDLVFLESLLEKQFPEPYNEAEISEDNANDAEWLKSLGLD